jgi:hypothetical protein
VHQEGTVELSELRPWLIYIHIAAAFAFVLAHGVSVWVAFALRADPEPGRVRMLLDLSGSSITAVYISLLVILVAGIVAALQAEQFSRGWTWAALVVVVIVIGAMYGLGSMYYARVRNAVGQRSYRDKADAPDPTPLPSDELAALLDSRRPELLAAIGGIGLLVLLWLMRFRPF